MDVNDYIDLNLIDVPASYAGLVDIVGDHWLWNGSCNPRSGYGQVWIAGKLLGAHKAMWEYINGDVPAGYELGHTCEFKNCVRHVRPVTHAVNVAEGRSGQNWKSKTHCPHGHEYTKENTYIAKSGSRRCRQCGRMRSQGIQLNSRSM